jgi:hypothetical protein
MICNAVVFPISGYIATGLYKPYILNYAIPVLPILLSISNPINLTIVSFYTTVVILYTTLLTLTVADMLDTESGSVKNIKLL